MKNPTGNKVKTPAANKPKQPAETKIELPLPQPDPTAGKVFIEILPGRGIGGVGGPGTRGWMEEAPARQYEADGYVRIFPAQPVTVVPSDAAGEKGEKV